MGRNKHVSLLLRLGLAFGFIYVGISSFLKPQAWIGFLPGFLRSEGFLFVHAIFVILLGAWLIYGKKTFYSAIVSAVFLFLIVIFNLGALDIIFRDVSILLAAIALAVLEYKK